MANNGTFALFLIFFGGETTTQRRYVIARRQPDGQSRVPVAAFIISFNIVNNLYAMRVPVAKGGALPFYCI